MGLLGQAIVSDSNLVWVTKTHYPLGRSENERFNAEKMIVIARNPIDVMPSLANLVNLSSHSLEINERYDKVDPVWWQSWVTGQTGKMKQNHDRVIELAREIPTFFMRYEDLKINPEPVLTDLFCFLLNVDSLEDTLCAQRIRDVSASGFTTKTAYALKSTSNNLCRNRDMYSEEQLEAMSETLSEMINFWGYNKAETCFFDSVPQ